MGRHFRRYCFSLAGKLKMTVKELLNKMDSDELSEWMAYDMTQNPEWVKKYNRDLELEASRSMTPEEKTAAFKRLFKSNK